MKLGLAIDHGSRTLDLQLERVKRCEELGYDSVWTAEVYGTDAITPLAAIASHTKRIRLGTGIMQLAGRTPAMAAMQLGTIDQIAGGGRVIGGIGVSGPQIVEGWYGQPWGDPKLRLRDYTLIMKTIFAREAPAAYQGKEMSLPYDGPDATGMGKPLKSILHFEDKPKIFHGTGAKATVIMSGEVADGWLSFGMRKNNASLFTGWLEEGFKLAGGGKSFANFEVQGGVTVAITDDLKSALAAAKPFIALYVGGMGHPKMNFHKKRMTREGWGEAADRIHELFQAGKKQEAIAAVPDQYIDEGGLFGPVQRIKERWRSDWEGMPYSGVTVRAEQDEAFELMADLTGSRDLARG